MARQSSNIDYYFLLSFQIFQHDFTNKSKADKQERVETLQ